MLASVDDLIHLALDVTELILLRCQLQWLLELVDLAAQVVELLGVGHILHLQVVVVLNERFHLLFQRLLVHGLELVLESDRLVKSYWSKTIALVCRRLLAGSQRGRI